jgi:predicted RNA-binding protein associated with RNAse of E/G family
MITYWCFFIYLCIGHLIEKRRYERKVAKNLLQNYQVDLSDRATNVKKRILSEDAILDMISASKKNKSMMSLDSLQLSQRLLQLTRKV